MKKNFEKWNEVKLAKRKKTHVKIPNHTGFFCVRKIQSNGMVKLDNSIYVDYRLIEVTRLSNKIGIFDKPD